MKGVNRMYNLSAPVSANYVHAKPYGTSSGSLRVYIPAIMNSSLIPMGSPKTTPVSLDKSCYSNAGDCKPSVASMLNTQNFVTAAKPYSSYKDPCYYYGDTISVIPTAGDFLSCRLVPEETDNSKNWPY